METPKITAVKKEKDPKRVEAGKRLAAISVKARENKLREKIEAENSWCINYGYAVGVAGVLVAAVVLLYPRKKEEVVRFKPVYVEKDPPPAKPELDTLE